MPERIVDNLNCFEPAVIQKNMPVCVPINSKDGVFSNLDAKPEVIQIEQVGQYMDKPPSYTEAASSMPPSYQESLDDFNIIEGMLIGKKITFKEVNIHLFR